MIVRRSTAAAALAVIGWVLLPIVACAIPRAGDAAPSFHLPGARGGKVALGSFAGKPTYLNFFASWCGPCNSEAPSVARVYRTYHERGLMLMGIDVQESASKALGFAHTYGWSFPIALDDGSTAATYGAIGLPVHVFIDKHGHISTYRLGEMSPPEIQTAIRKILQQR